ncbi:metal ABC transporter permease [candidate division KSB1 bacterium]|nr:metal ABC transporter permease [candidate division KSB1 bacterium]
MIVIFGYLGIHVLEREIIFIDIALAQIAAVGSTSAFILFRTEEHSLIAYICALGFSLLAAVFFSQVGKRVTQIPQEAIIGVSYAIAAAAALFLLAMAAGGDVHLEHMLTGSILWAKWSDILPCAGVYAAVGLFHYIFRDKFRKISRDYQGAIKEGIKVGRWDFLFYASLGIVVTFSIRIAGVLVVFSFLIIPATFAAMFAQSWGKRLTIAWGIGLAASIAGLAFSYLFDFSSGPSVITFLGLALIVTALVKQSKP